MYSRAVTCAVLFSPSISAVRLYAGVLIIMRKTIMGVSLGLVYDRFRA